LCLEDEGVEMSEVGEGAEGGRKIAYTVAEFAEAYGVGRTLIYVEIKAGRLRSKRAGGRRLILAGDARAWFDALPETGRRTAA
jgi:excisionase family DNA binding protein